YIYNRSNKDYDSTYIGLWSDYHIGLKGNERIATDTVRDLLYAYNDTSFSKGFLDSTAEGFGAAPPAVGITFLNKPLQYSIHTDNLSSPTGKPQKKEDYYNFLKRYFT